MIPTLTTERLVLRAFNEQTDFEPFYAFYRSERSRQYGGPLDLGGSWRKAASFMGHWLMRGYGVWTIEEQASGDFCGMAGLWYPIDFPEREVTYFVTEAKGGRGIATEAALAARDFAYDELGWETLVSNIGPDNTSSKRLVERMGAVYERSAVSPDGREFNIYRHQSKEVRQKLPLKVTYQH